MLHLAPYQGALIHHQPTIIQRTLSLSSATCSHSTETSTTLPSQLPFNFLLRAWNQWAKKTSFVIVLPSCILTNRWDNLRLNLFFKKHRYRLKALNKTRVHTNRLPGVFFLYLGFQSHPIPGTGNYRYPRHHATEQSICSQGRVERLLSGMGKGHPHSDLEGSRAINQKYSLG